MTSLVDALNEWIAARPLWQQTVIGQLASGIEFAPDDYRRIAEMLIEATADNDGSTTPPRIEPAEIRDQRVRLASIEVIGGVNALVPQQILDFGPTGLTVVYGDNAAGKSGFARILKHAIQARGGVEVLSDVFSEQQNQIPMATVTATVATNPSQDFAWTDDTSSLTHVQFYDSVRGSNYVSNKSEVTYRPHELSFLESLIGVCDGVAAQLNQMLQRNSQPFIERPNVSSKGKAAKFIETFSAATTDEEIEQACATPDDIADTLMESRKAKARIEAADLGVDKQILERAASACEHLANHFSQLWKDIGFLSIVQIESACQHAVEMEVVARIAIGNELENQPLAGTGSDSWRLLWEAARDFSNRHAYPAHSFPHVGANARCVLCQQILNQDARLRFTSFEEAVAADVAQRAQEAETEASRLLANAEAIDVDPPLIVTAIHEIAQLDDTFAHDLQSQLDRFTDVKNSVSSRDFNDAFGRLAGYSLDRQLFELRHVTATYRKQAQGLDTIIYDEQLSVINSEILNLEDQIEMNKAREAMLREVRRLRLEKRIREVQRLTSTSQITNEATKLTRRFVTNQLQEQFVEEASALRIRRVALHDDGGKKGQMQTRPVLENTVHNHPLQRVLSDGEQNALGLARFFVDVYFDETKSSVVLDDPVSSLDHLRRDRVARRLAELARDRQVIIFTHDLAFIANLNKQADILNVPITKRKIVRTPADGLPGVVSTEHPWAAKGTSNRIKELKAELEQIKTDASGWDQKQYETRVRDWVGKLSETIERSIREVVGRVVDPTTTEVHPKMFRLFVKITDVDDQELKELHDEVAKLGRRHDKALIEHTQIPDIDRISELLKNFEAWWKRVRQYGG